MLRGLKETSKEKRLQIHIPITLEYTDTGGDKCLRLWGFLEIKVGDPFFEAVFRRKDQLWWKFRSDNEVSISGHSTFEHKLITSVLLECHCPDIDEASSSGYEESFEEGYSSPELDELMSTIEQDAMSLNKSYGKMKASIVRTRKAIPLKYMFESLMIIRVHAWGRLTMFGSVIKVKKTPYGFMRVGDDPFFILRMCFWYSIGVLYVLSKWLFHFILFIGPLLCWIAMAIIRKLFVCGWWLVMQIPVACRYLYRRVGQIMKRKEKEF